MSPDPPHSMLEALAWAARNSRRNGTGRHHVALTAGVSPTTVGRFERAEAWPWDPEALIAAYAYWAELDPREIWAAAVHAWQTADNDR